MGDSRTKNASRNIVWGFLEKLAAIIMPFIVRTALIYTLGAEYVGLNGLFSSILQVLSISELGFGSAIVFSMYKPVAENDEKSLRALLNFYRRVYYIVGTVILIAGIGLLPFLSSLIKGDYPQEVNIQVLFVLYLLNTVLSYYLYAYKAALFSAFQRNDVISKRNASISVLLGVSQIIGLVLFRSYYIYVLLIPLSTIVTNIANAYVAKRMFPNITCEGTIMPEEKAALKKRITGLISFKVYGVVFSSVDTIVVSTYLGLIPLAIFNNYIYIQTAVAGFLNILSTSITAGIGNKMITNSVDDNYRDFKKYTFARGWICSWCAVCLLCLYQPFMELWVGKELLFPIDTMALMVMYFFIPQITNLTFTYREAAGLWWEDRFRPLIAAFVNLCINILLVQIIGINGVIISTLVCSIFINIPWGTHILFKNYFKRSEWQYFVRIVYYVLITAIAGFATYYICGLINMAGIGGLLVKVLLCIMIPNIIFYLCYLNLSEFKTFSEMMKQYFSKRLRGS